MLVEPCAVEGPIEALVIRAECVPADQAAAQTVGSKQVVTCDVVRLQAKQVGASCRFIQIGSGVACRQP